jgi:hypothetical protein
MRIEVSRRALFNPAAVERYLKGVQYPASKQDIIDCAERNRAPDGILEILQSFVDRQYPDGFAVGIEIDKIAHKLPEYSA